jgi:hypothetical protein
VCVGEASRLQALLSSPTQYFTAFEDGTDRWFRNVGKLQSDAGETPKRTNTLFKTRRKFEIKKFGIIYVTADSKSTASRDALFWVITQGVVVMSY